MTLSNSTPRGIVVRVNPTSVLGSAICLTVPVGGGGTGATVEISLEDFLLMAHYVLTITDLAEFDQRSQFVCCVQGMRKYAGHNPGGTRLVSSTPPIFPVTEQASED